MMSSNRLGTNLIKQIYGLLLSASCLNMNNSNFVEGLWPQSDAHE